MKAHIFLHPRDGRTLWVPSHAASGTETSPVVMLKEISPEELMQSFYLFDEVIEVVSAEMKPAVPNGKTVEEIYATVNQFRTLCAFQEGFLLSRTYKASPSNSVAVIPPEANSQIPLVGPPAKTFHSQLVTNPPPGHEELMTTPAPNPPGNYPPSFPGGYSSYPSAPYPSNPPHPLPGYHGPTPTLVPAMVPPPLAPSFSTPEGAPPVPPRIPPVVNRAVGYPHAADLPPYPMPSSENYGYNEEFGSLEKGGAKRFPADKPSERPPLFHIPEPIDKHSKNVQVPMEIRQAYQKPLEKIIIGVLPASHVTVWLRNYDINGKNQKGRETINLGLDMIVVPYLTAEDVQYSKPVLLFPRQACLYFLIHSFCNRSNCYHAHHNAEQLRELVVIRHTEQQAMTKEQRYEMAKGIIEHDKEMAKLTTKERLKYRDRKPPPPPPLISPRDTGAERPTSQPPKRESSRIISDRGTHDRGANRESSSRSTKRISERDARYSGRKHIRSPSPDSISRRRYSEKSRYSRK